MGLQITLDVTTATPDQVRGVVDLLRTVCPAAFDIPHGKTLVAQAALAALGGDEADWIMAASPEQAMAAAFAGDHPTPPADGAPSAPPPAPDVSPVVAGVPTDRSGLPFDARIHSMSNGAPVTNSDGTWRKKRGVHDDTVRIVEAQLRQAMAAPAVDTVAPPPPADTAAPPPPPPADTVAPPPPADTVAPPPPADTAAPPPPPAPVTAHANPFAAFMAKVGPLQAAGKLSTEELNSMVTAAGLPNIVGLMSRPDLIPTVEAQVDLLAVTRG